MCTSWHLLGWLVGYMTSYNGKHVFFHQWWDGFVLCCQTQRGVASITERDYTTQPPPSSLGNKAKPHNGFIADPATQARPNWLILFSPSRLRRLFLNWGGANMQPASGLHWRKEKPTKVKGQILVSLASVAFAKSLTDLIGSSLQLSIKSPTVGNWMYGLDRRKLRPVQNLNWTEGNFALYLSCGNDK